MKQLNVFALNAKDVKDHLPMDPQEEASALWRIYAGAGIKFARRRSQNIAKDEDADIRAKFEYASERGSGVIVRRRPCAGNSAAHREFVKEYDIRIAIHNHGPGISCGFGLWITEGGEGHGIPVSDVH